jgi:hypothetical protein
MNKLVFVLSGSIIIFSTWLSDVAAGVEIIKESDSVTVNQPPFLEPIGSKSTREDQQLKFTVKATDEESVPALTAEGLPEHAHFSDYGDGTGVFDWKPSWSAFGENTGSFVMTFYATDDSGAVAYEEITIAVHRADDRGWDFTILGNFSAPQGTFSRYADGGLGLSFRATYHPKFLKAFGLWSDFNYTWFGSDNSDVLFDDPEYKPIAEQSITQNAISMHIGAQFGSKSRRAFFRPRAAIGPGLYIFYTTNTITAEDWWGEEEEFTGFEDTYGRFGWRIIIGADFCIKARVGMALELVYDHVHNLDQPEGFHSPRFTTRFNGFSAGAVVSY